MSAVQDKSNLVNVNSAFFVAWESIFGGGRLGSGAWSILTEEIPASDSDRLEFVQTAFMGTVREWKGANKVLNPMRAYKQVETLREWEYSIGIDRKDVEYDKLDVVSRAIGRGMARADLFTDKIMFDSLVQASGAGPTGYDGVGLISASHPMADGTTQSNTTTTALSFDQYDAVQLAAQGFADHSGEPMGVMYNTLIVGPKLRRLALEIAGGEVAGQWVATASGAFAQQGASAATAAGAFAGVNVFRGEVNVVVWDRLVGDYDDYYYLADTTKGDKPLILGNHRGFTPVNLDKITDEPRVLNGQYIYTLEADLTPAAGSWPLIYGGIV